MSWVSAKFNNRNALKFMLRIFVLILCDAVCGSSVRLEVTAV
jgi:hypothetical protein